MRRKEPCRQQAGRLTWPAFATLLTLAAPCGSVAAGELPQVTIGRSVVVVNQVKGQYGNQTPRELKINDDIIFHEDIFTGNESKTIIEFRDGSTFELGPYAVAHIDSFIYNPSEKVSHKTLSITSGSFRYLSGSAVSDQDTKISTPSGTLGPRG